MINPINNIPICANHNIISKYDKMFEQSTGGMIYDTNEMVLLISKEVPSQARNSVIFSSYRFRACTRQPVHIGYYRR